jgi:predicted nucleic acid-binding protein
VTDRFALDTSALFTWLDAEPGKDRISELLRSHAEVFIPWPALMELYYLLVRRQGKPLAQEIYTGLKHIPASLITDWNEALWLQAAEFKSRYRISLADAQIAALARSYNAVLVHKDPEYQALAQELKLEALPLKPRHRT